MVKSVKMLAAAFAVVALVATASARADDKEKKDVTLKGEVCCAKCALKMSDKCATVIKVKEKDKDVVYYFTKEGKDPHKDICTGGKDGSVTGKVTEKDGKKYITVSKVEFKDKEKK